MRLIWVTILCVIVVLGIFGCQKDKGQGIPWDAPVIKFISIEPDTAIKYQDIIKITIAYIDSDGDLGQNSPDVKNLFCTDSRDSVTYQFRINQLAPDSARIFIYGNLIFDLAPQGFINDSDTVETATYSIYVKDRAGNQSNIIQTSPLVIKQ